MKQVKFLVTFLFYYCGFFKIIRLWNYIFGKRLTILTFHKISDTNSSQTFGLPSINIPLINFEFLIKFISKHYHIISLSEYLTIVHEKSKPHEHCLILTFDDAYEEVQENVLPILKKYHLPSILFVPTAAIDGDGFFWWDAFFELLSNSDYDHIVTGYLNNHQDDILSRSIKGILYQPQLKRDHMIYNFIELVQNSNEEQREEFIEFIDKIYIEFGQNNFKISSILNWNGIKNLFSSGVDIGSHTKNHRFLSTLPDEEVREELQESKKELEKHLHHPITSFAYPGGKYTHRTIQLLRDTGYTCAFVTESGLNTVNDSIYELKRINIWDNKVSRSGKFSKAITAWHLFFMH